MRVIERKGKTTELWLITDRFDLDADLVAIAYRYRWSVELFFRWLKCVAKFEHLISHSQNGITIQFYVAVIGVLLTYIRTGQRPGVYEFRCLSWVARGMMDVATMHEVLALRQRERDQNKARRLTKLATQNQA